MAAKGAEVKFFAEITAIIAFCVFWCVPVSAQKTVWRADDLNRQEIQNLYDIFSITSSWINASSDDATVQFSRNGLAGQGGAWWPVFLNGTRLHQQIWDTQSLHVVPVTIAQLDSVVIIESPMLYNGSFTEKGGIFLYTKAMEEGVQAQGNLFFGNRSGDPGPFAYTDFATRNIERLGPVADAQVSYRNTNYGVQAGFKHFVHAVTDALQYRRLTPFEFGEGSHRHEKIRSTSFYVNGDVKTGIFTHQIQSGLTESTDFLFTNLYGTEIPIDRKWGFISLDGSGEINKNIEVSYGFNHNSNNIKEYPNKENRWLRWNQQVNTGKVSITHHFDKGFHQVGIEADFYRLKGEKSAKRTLHTQTLKAFHQTVYKFNNGLSTHTNMQVVKGENAAFKGNGGVRYKINFTHTLLFDATYSQRLPEEDNSLWYWMAEKGFGSDTLVNFQPSELPTRTKFLQAKLGWESSLSEHFDFDLSLVLSRNIDEYGMDYKIIPNGRRIESGEFNFINDLDASFFRMPINLRIDILPSIRQTFSYTQTHQLSGNEALFDMIPTHRLSTNLKWKPVDSFLLWTRFQAQSALKWALAEPIDGMEVRVNPLQTETYSSTTAPRFQWDMGIKKYFWERRVAFSLDMQNIGDQKFRNHPVSPRHAFTLFLGMHVDLP
ncbi:MAG: hypothetical protein WD059_14770 [Balneolaceae bacterium]